MVNKCCAPHCRGNYRGGPKVTVFRFPDNEFLKNQWLREIPRKDLVLTKSTRICEVHFQSSDIIREDVVLSSITREYVTVPRRRPSLREDAVPTIFPGCPSYLSADVATDTESPEVKRMKIDIARINELQEAGTSTTKEEEVPCDQDPLSGPVEDEPMIDVPSGSGSECIVIKQEPIGEVTEEPWTTHHLAEYPNEDEDDDDLPIEIPLKCETDPIPGEVIPLDLDEDDLLYFKSLAADLVKLTPELKDVFRIKVRNILKELTIRC